MNSQTDSFNGPGPKQVFEQALANGEFRIQQCSSCGRHIFYPRVLCRYCGSSDLKWVQPSGKAIVYSTSVVRQRPERGPDYNIALVDLDEGPRMLTRVVDISPEEVKIGMHVQGFISEIDGEPAYVFRPVTGGDC